MENKHQHWMHQALTLARKGFGWTNPNPCVGAVIVKEGELLGQGYHRLAGQPHAEIQAIRDCRAKGHTPAGATMYVTLEPCSTYGRTPPCTQAILEHQLGTVVIGTTDPNPDHKGKAFGILERAGVQVVTNVLEEECRLLNRSFNYWVTSRMPWVIVKVALTADGYMAMPPQQNQWLTSQEAKLHVHQLRATCDAILVGAQTVRTDNPQLTIRDVPHARELRRIILTQSGDLPTQAHVFTDELAHLTQVFKGQTWRQVLNQLGEQKIMRLLVEGGEQTITSLVETGLVHELHIYHTPHVAAPPQGVHLPRADALSKLQLEQVTTQPLGPDHLTHGFVVAQG